MKISIVNMDLLINQAKMDKVECVDRVNQEEFHIHLKLQVPKQALLKATVATTIAKLTCNPCSNYSLRTQASFILQVRMLQVASQQNLNCRTSFKTKLQVFLIIERSYINLLEFFNKYIKSNHSNSDNFNSSRSVE